jgi:hypothetical protein
MISNGLTGVYLNIHGAVLRAEFTLNASAFLPADTEDAD